MARRLSDRYIQMNLSLPPEVAHWIEEHRGEETRSAFVAKHLKEIMEKSKK